LRIVLFVISCLFQFSASSQISSVTVLSQDTIEIGEPFLLQFKISSPKPEYIKNLELSFVDSIINLNSSYKDSLETVYYADFEISDYGVWPNNEKTFTPELAQWKKNGNSFLLEIQMNGVIWDYGVFQIPGLEVAYDDTVTRQIRTQNPVLFVLPPAGFAPQDTTEAIASIKPIITEEKTIEDYLWIAYLLGALLLFALLFYFIKKLGNEALEIEEAPVEVRPAHIIANEKLSSLQQDQIWKEGKIKSYQSQLTFIIREYLENRYDIHALESTTDEILKDIRQQDFDNTYESDLKQILTIADLVKFAKAKPSDDIHESFLHKAVAFVEGTKLIPTTEPEDE